MPDLILHITGRAEWEAAKRNGAYEPAAFAADGFIHCSTATQVVETANRIFRGRRGLVLLCIDVAKVGPEVRYENLDGGSTLFPHIYGRLAAAAVIAAVDFPPGREGAFALPALPGAAGALPRLIEVYATEYDGAFHWRHPARLVEEHEGFLVTETSAGLEIATTRGPWTDPWNTRGFYWPDRWYNVIRLEEPDGRLSGFYCNIATPAELDGETLRYIDLQLDVRATSVERPPFEPVHEARRPHGTSVDGLLRYEVWDEDEFEAARVKYGYPDELVRLASAALDELRRLIEGRVFPFDA
jgi:uncharacterized protein (DUF952 family)/protein associated with RNAse G/E